MPNENRISQLFEDYLRASEVNNLDPLLGSYLNSLKRYLEEKDIEEARQIIAQLSLIFSLHLSRKHRMEDLLNSGNIDVMLSSFNKDELDWLRESLSKIHKGMGEKPITWSLLVPINSVGYDPTFRTPADRKAHYDALLASAHKRGGDRISYNSPTFKDSYSEAKAAVYKDFHYSADSVRYHNH